MLSKTILSLFIIALYSSCERTISDFHVEDKPSKIVIHGAINPNSVFKVNLSKSLSFNDTDKYYPINDAAININNEASSLPFPLSIGEGWYSNTEIVLEVGKNYTMRADAPGFEQISTNFEIPEKPNFTGFEYKVLKMSQNPRSPDSDDPALSIDLTFKDDGSKQNYYTVEILMSDARLRKSVTMKSSSRIIEVAYSNFKFYKSLAENDARGEKYIFSDRYFNGQSYTLQLLVNLSDLIYSPEDDFTFQIVLSQVEKKYLAYALNMADVQRTSDNLLAEPVTGYQSVENGFGLVYGLNSDVRYINSKDLNLEDFESTY